MWVAFQTYTTDGRVLLLAMGFGCLLLAYNTMRTLIIRMLQTKRENLGPIGLDLHPTVWSEGGNPEHKGSMLMKNLRK